MAYITSIGVCSPPYQLNQETTVEFARELFSESFHDIDRLLKVFANGNIEKRNFAAPLDWFKEDHSFEDKNDLFVSSAVSLSVEAIQSCLTNLTFLKNEVDFKEIDAIFFITSSGLATPSIEAKLMNELPFSSNTKRIPIWGLGCAGGAAGLSRAFEYCKAFPKANVLVISVELCSLTFQRNDRSKSNLVGTSIFADGVACALLSGRESLALNKSKLPKIPQVQDTQSTLMPDSEDVMGWNIKNAGFHVVFSRDIPTIVRNWLSTNVETFLGKAGLSFHDISHFVAHPGGKKVLEAYEDALQMSKEMTKESANILRKHGNMSSATVLYVLKAFMEKKIIKNDFGLVTALGPGFSSELLLLQWK